MISSALVVSALKDCHLSNTAIANATGICSLSISHYRRGVKTPNHVNTKKLADFFGVRETVSVIGHQADTIDYEEIIHRKDQQIEQLMAMIAALTGTSNNIAGARS